MNHFVKSLLLFFLLCCHQPKIIAQAKVDNFQKIIPFTVYKSIDDKTSIKTILQKDSLFTKLLNTQQKNNPKDSYWIRADFTSVLPLLKKDSVWFLHTGVFYNITYYFQDKNTIGIKEYGPLNTKEKYTFYSPKDGVYFSKENLINNTFLYFKVKRIVSSDHFERLQLKLRSAQQKTIESNYYRWEDVVEASRDYLFVGAFLIIFVFTFLTYLLSKRLDFLFYSLYTFCILLYLGRSAYNTIVFLTYDYTVFSIWLHSSLQIFINLFYVAFAKHYLVTKLNYPKLDKAIRIIAVYLGLSIVLVSYFTITLQLDAQILIMDIHRIVMSVFAVAAVIYLLLYTKNALAYFIIIGSLLFTAGALIMLFTKDRHYMMLGSVAELLLFGLGLNYKMRKDGEEKILLKQTAYDNQISALRAQMNPHFIFNSLSSIQHLITSGNKESAIKYLNKFSLLMRNLLESSIEAKIVLSEEISLLKKYLSLEALRFNYSFKYTVSVNDNLDAEAIEVPALLVQPFVENAILHGLLNKTEADKLLEVRFRKKNEFIICEIEDNGIGRKASAEKKSPLKASKKSRGIQVTEKRLELLNNFQANSIQIIDKTNEQGQAEGTLVILKISIE